MHGETLLDHFRSPRNAGVLEPPAASIEVTNPVCGDTLKLWVRWDGDIAAEVRFQARGCTAAIACGSALTELLTGRTRAGINAITAPDIEAAIGGLINESKHAAVLCRDAARQLSKT